MLLCIYYYFFIQFLKIALYRFRNILQITQNHPFAGKYIDNIKICTNEPLDEEYIVIDYE